MDIWFTKRTGMSTFDVLDCEGLAFYLTSIGWRHITHTTHEVCRLESDNAVIILYPDNRAQVTGENVQHAIDTLEAANGLSREADIVDMFGRCFAYLRELRDLRISQEMAGSVQ